MRRKITVSILALLVISGFAYAADSFRIDDWIKVAAPSENSFFVGLELAELRQRNFTDIGLRNFTFHAGQRCDVDLPFSIGWSFLAFYVNCSTEHIRDTRNVLFIEGDRTVLSADTGEADVWFDGSFNLLSLVKIHDRYLLRMVPELGIGLGYGLWGFKNDRNNQSYRLEAMTLLARASIRTTFFDVLYLDYPLLNFSIYLLKNRPVYGDLGDVKITRPELFGLRALMAAGIIIKF